MRTISLELLRHGSDHNQLLSPSVPYLAVCENHPVCTLYLPYEHEQLLGKLRALRYVGAGSGDESFRQHVEQQRRLEVSNLGRDLGKWLKGIPGLLSALGAHRSKNAGTPTAQTEPVGSAEFIHLRLVLSANELALLPFELAISEVGMPNPGQAMALQLNTPFCLTRESRRASRVFYQSPTTPKILFAYASAGSVVPFEAHLLALRAACDPWLRGRKSAARFSEMLTVLPEATLADISAACRANSYTHVHILAHGSTLDAEQNALLAIALNHKTKQVERVTGNNLARALRVLDGDRELLHRPMVVTLASCDSGAVQPIPLSPRGDSLAHALHEAGIPMVVASQFPLSFEGSVVMAETLYKHLLRARDPREALIDVRHELARVIPQSHDWASIVCYLSLPSDFATANWRAQIERLRQYLLKSVYEQFDNPKDSAKTSLRKPSKAAESLFSEAIASLLRFDFGEVADPLARSDIHTLLAGTQRRYAQWLWEHRKYSRAEQQLECALQSYLQSYGCDRARHWVLISALRLDLLLNALQTGYVSALGDQAGYWNMLLQAVEIEANSTDPAKQLWAWADLIELYAMQPALPNSPRKLALPPNSPVLEYAEAMRKSAAKNPEAVTALQRQLQRYQAGFYLKMGKPCQAIAASVAAVLAPEAKPRPSV